MKLERIRKDKKKKIIIGSMIVLSVVGCLTLTTTRAKYRSIQNIKLANGTIDYKTPDIKLAIKISEDGTTYKNSSTIPEGNYTLNEEKSKCRIPTSTLVGEEAPEAEGVTIEYVDHKINVLGVTKKDTKCYIYFDKKLGQTSSTIISDIKARTDGSYKGNTAPTFTEVATGAEIEANNGIFETEDPMYGENAKTYYWRGATATNHVIFDNKCWRIVRINGDGSIRLIYNGAPSDNTCSENGSNADSIVLSGTEYNSNRDNSSYVGWTYNVGSQRPSEDNPQTSGMSAVIKTKLEAWYDINILDRSKIALGKFCNDRNIANDEGWRAIGSNQLYAAHKRLSSGTQTPTISCPNGDVYSLSVGMITADEVQLAGASYNKTNTSYYLFNGEKYWTMTPLYWYASSANMFIVYNEKGSLSGSSTDSTNIGVRPVINLRSDVTFDVGSDGTATNPYVVK